jgi:hypothetical protein
MLLTILIYDDIREEPKLNVEPPSFQPSPSYEVDECFPEFDRLPCPLYPSIVWSLNNSNDWRRWEVASEESLASATMAARELRLGVVEYELLQREERIKRLASESRVAVATSESAMMRAAWDEMTPEEEAQGVATGGFNQCGK